MYDVENVEFKFSDSLGCNYNCDLSPWFFCIDAALLCKFESDKIWVNEFEYNRSR